MRQVLPDILSALRQALFPPDPGSFRLIAAARATLGGLLALALTAAVETVLPMAPTARVLAFAVATFLGALVRDTGRRQQAVTIAVSPLPVFATVVLTALSLTFPLLPDLLTVVLVFAAICAASCGPRWAALGAVSLIALLIALLSHITLTELPSRLLLIVIAAASAACVRFVILPERPGAELRRLHGAIDSGIAGLLDEIAAALTRGGWGSRDRRRLRRAAMRMNEAVMLVQPRLAPTAAMHLLETDLLSERVARVALLDLGTTGQRPTLLAQVTALRRMVRGEPTSEQPQPEAGSGGRLGVLLTSMARQLGGAPPEALPETLPPGRAPFAPPARPWATLEVRPAIQAALATALAIVGGELVSPTRWYYAVFAAFAVFQGTRSRGESIAKAVAMLAGSVAGVVIGVLVATLLTGHQLLAMAAIAGGLFLAFCASNAAYGVMIFWLTVILGLVYGLLGYFPPSLLLIRLQETAVGAAAGMAVACLVLARPTPNLVRRCAADFLRSLALVVQAAARPLLGQPAEGDLASLVLNLEQRYQAFRTLSVPLVPGARLLGPERSRRLALLLAACDEWARELVRTTLHMQPVAEPIFAATAAQTTARIVNSISALTAFLDQRAPAAERPPSEPTVSPTIPAGHTQPIHATRLLVRLDEALLHLRQRLAA